MAAAKKIDIKDKKRTAQPDAVELDLDGPDENLASLVEEAVEAVEEIERNRDHKKTRNGAAAEELGVGDVVQPADSTDSSETRREYDTLRREAAESKERYLRTLADFENFRKRNEREQQEFRRYALVEPMREMLPVIDNLSRALGAEGSLDDLKAGVEMILRQLHDIQRRFGVEVVETDGESFDPAVHEAVSRIVSPEVEKPTVVATHQAGYKIHDRLLRPAMVSVAVPAKKEEAS